VARPRQQPVLHEVQLQVDGQIAALVAESSLDQLYDADGSLLADYSGTTEERVLLRRDGGDLLMVDVAPAQ
jgi:hypothetical protein